VEIRHALALDQRQCPACGGHVVEMAGQYETSERITTLAVIATPRLGFPVVGSARAQARTFSIAGV
jgi:hypothetical protein